MDSPERVDGTGNGRPLTPGEERERLLAALPSLVRELAAGGITELEVSTPGASLYLRQRPELTPLADGEAEGEAEDGAPALDEGLVVVAAPLTGVFYTSPSPDEPAYVNPGDTVEAGHVVALVEAMKVFNEIRADVAGTVEAILTGSGQAVRAGQALLTLRVDPGSAASGEAPQPA